MKKQMLFLLLSNIVMVNTAIIDLSEEIKKMEKSAENIRKSIQKAQAMSRAHEISLPEAPWIIDSPCVFATEEFEEKFKAIIEEKLSILEANGFSEEEINDCRQNYLSNLETVKNGIVEKLEGCNKNRETLMNRIYLNELER